MRASGFTFQFHWQTRTETHSKPHILLTDIQNSMHTQKITEMQNGDIIKKRRDSNYLAVLRSPLILISDNGKPPLWSMYLLLATWSQSVSPCFTSVSIILVFTFLCISFVLCLLQGRVSMVLPFVPLLPWKSDLYGTMPLPVLVLECLRCFLAAAWIAVKSRPEANHSKHRCFSFTITQ